MEILLYNGFNFHHEMVGFMLDFALAHDIKITLVSVYENSWILLYKKKYDFVVLDKLPDVTYDFTILLTEYDFSFPKHLITDKVVGIKHFIRSHQVLPHYFNIAPFLENDTYTFPVFKSIEYETKMEKMKPIITFIGQHSPREEELTLITNLDEFDVYVLGKNIPTYTKPNIHAIKNIPAEDMFEILFQTAYIGLLLDDNYLSVEKLNCQAISGSLPLSFTTGCKMIMPKATNKWLKLTSVIAYDGPFCLKKDPCLRDTFLERDRLIKLRDESILDIILK